MSFFLFELFFNLKILLTFIFIVTHTHPGKKVMTRLETLTYVECLTGFLADVLTDVCPSMTFSNGRDLIEL